MRINKNQAKAHLGLCLKPEKWSATPSIRRQVTSPRPLLIGMCRLQGPLVHGKHLCWINKGLLLKLHNSSYEIDSVSLHSHRFKHPLTSFMKYQSCCFQIWRPNNCSSIPTNKGEKQVWWSPSWGTLVVVRCVVWLIKRNRLLDEVMT